jgi:hypothetical protein
VTDFRPQELLRVLRDHGVRFVLIGGFAATLYGSAVPTFDVDITPESTEENLARLSAALKALDARVRVEGIPEGLPFAHDPASLAAMTTLNLVTRHGDLDIAFQPAGVGGFADWEARAKDHAQLPILRALLARVRRSTS